MYLMFFQYLLISFDIILCSRVSTVSISPSLDVDLWQLDEDRERSAMTRPNPEALCEDLQFWFKNGVISLCQPFFKLI